MKRFDPMSKCWKCGDFAKTKWYSSMEALVLANIDHEFLGRVCVRCGHRWRELPLDAPESKEK